MADDLAALSLAPHSLAAAYEDGLSPRAVIAEVYRRIAADHDRDPAVWIRLVDRAAAMAAADRLPADRSLPLWGVPFAVKDNIDAEGLETTAGCPAYAYRPDRDATVVARLRAAGAILIGKANLDQFATGLVGTRSPHGAPRSVHDARYVSGGSSSGSAVAVAAGLVGFALGTDTAGSGRVPAAFNGLVGIKPTPGLVPSTGVVPACASLDCVTVFAASAADGDAVRRVMAGVDPADPFSRAVAPVCVPAGRPRVGVLPPEQRETFGDQGAARLYDRAVAALGDLGWPVAAIDYAPLKDCAALLYAGPWVAERAAAVGDFVAADPDRCDPTVAQIIMGAGRYSARDAFEGRYQLQAYLRTAQPMWDQVDLLLLPTAPTQYTVAEVQADPVRLNANLGLYTNFVNLMGLAAVAVPAGTRALGGADLPFGVTLIGPGGSDGDLAHLADRLHRHLVPDAPGPVLARRHDGAVLLAVVGAHLTGQPLNHQLTDLGAELVEATATSSAYDLYALAGTVPAKPGLARRSDGAGHPIAVEVWRLTPAALGAFTALVPPPLAIGSVELASGAWVKGFVCEGHALEQAEPISRHGGWRAYLAAQAGS